MESRKENLSKFYFKKLHATNRPGALLANFLCEILGKKIVNSDYAKVGKLVRMYGRESVFFAILDVYDMENAPDNYYPYITAILKSRLARKNKQAGYPTMVNFEDEVKELDKKARQIKKERTKND